MNNPVDQPKVSELDEKALDTSGHPSLFRALPGYPWLDPCPRCGFRGSCDCTVLERARAAHPGLTINEKGAVQ